MRRYLIISGIAVGAMVLIGGGVLLLIDRSPSLQNAIEKRANLNQSTNVNGNQNQNQTVTTKPKDTDLETIKFITRNFVEQYGSSTSDDGYSGILRVTKWGTAALNVQIQSFVATQRQNPSTVYRSTLTKVLVIDVPRRTATTATVSIGTQRQETTGVAVQAYNQNITLGFLKQGSEWKVDSVVWQPR